MHNVVEINEILHVYSIKFKNSQGNYCAHKGLVVSPRGLSIDRNMFCVMCTNKKYFLLELATGTVETD